MFVFSLGLEVLEVMPEPDVVVVCCGGGGLLAGVAAAIKLSGCDKTRIYGVEPEGGKTRRQIRIKGVSYWEAKMNLKCLFGKTACTMYKSLIEKKPVGMDSKSIASGLAPPFAGITYLILFTHNIKCYILVLVFDLRVPSDSSNLSYFSLSRTGLRRGSSPGEDKTCSGHSGRYQNTFTTLSRYP